MRDNKWLAQRLKSIWEKFFSDIPQKNDVYVRFGRRSRTRLGSIMLDRRSQILTGLGILRLLAKRPHTIITLNGYFKNSRVPEFVVDATIAHELTHYAHGFSSPHRRAHYYPHYGGVVRKELAKRGLLELERAQKKWCKLHWRDIIE